MFRGTQQDLSDFDLSHVIGRNFGYGFPANVSAERESVFRKAKTGGERGGARCAIVQIPPRDRSVRSAGIKTGAGLSFVCGRVFRKPGRGSSGRRQALGKDRWRGEDA